MNGQRKRHSSGAKIFASAAKSRKRASCGSVFVLFASLVLVWFSWPIFLSADLRDFSIWRSARASRTIHARATGMDEPAGRFAMEKAFLMLAPVMGVLFLISFAATALANRLSLQ